MTIKQEIWNNRISAYKSSGLTQNVFCKEQRISRRQLNYWLQKDAAREIEPERTTQWLPVKLNNEGLNYNDGSLNIKIGIATIEVKPGFNQKFLLDVLNTVRSL